jgi:hypothetical protein
MKPFGVHVPPPMNEPPRAHVVLASAIWLLVSLPAWAGAENWKFVQSVGGMALGKPVLDRPGWILPVRIDVSGLDTVSVKPTVMNSALVCERVAVAIEQRNIYLTVVSGLARAGASPRCPPAELGRIDGGQYSVFYRSPGEAPVPLGDLSIGR